MNPMGDSRRLMPGFVPVTSSSNGGGGGGSSSSSPRRVSASAAPPSTRETQQQQFLSPMNGRRRTSVAQSSLTPELNQTGFVSTPQQHPHYSIGIQLPLSPPVTPTKNNGAGMTYGSDTLVTPGSVTSEQGRSPTSSSFPERRASSTAIRMNSVVFDESPAQLSVIDEGASTYGNNSPDPGRRASLAYDALQSNPAEKLYKAGSYHLRRAKSLSPTKLGLVAMLTLMIVYCLLLVVRVAFDTVSWSPPPTTKGEFRRAAQRAADFSKGMLAEGNVADVGRMATDQRARKAWGRGSRSKNEPIKPVRQIVMEEEDDDDDDGRLPPETEVSDEERERKIRENLARAAQKLRQQDEVKMIPRPGGGVQRAGAAPGPDALAAKRRKGAAREFGAKADLSKGKMRGEGGQVVKPNSKVKQEAAAPVAKSRKKIVEPEPVVVEEEEEEVVGDDEVEEQAAAPVKEEATAEGVAEEEGEAETEEEEEEEVDEPPPPPPKPAAKKVAKVQRVAAKSAPKAPAAPVAPARKAPIMAGDKMMRKNRRPLNKDRTGSRGPAPLDSSPPPAEREMTAAERLAAAEAQLAAAQEQLAAAAALEAAEAGSKGGMVPPQRQMNAKIEQMQKMRMSREGTRNRGDAPPQGGRPMDERVLGKDDSKEPRRVPMAMRANKKGMPARQKVGPARK